MIGIGIEDKEIGLRDPKGVAEALEVGLTHHTAQSLGMSQELHL